jgi:hypothetical protein
VVRCRLLPPCSYKDELTDAVARRLVRVRQSIVLQRQPDKAAQPFTFFPKSLGMES